MTEYEMPIEEQINRLAREFKSFGTRLDSIDAKLTTVEEKAGTTQALLQDTHALATRTHVLLEETNAVAKLGLEGIQGLRESMDQKFADAKKANAQETELLKSPVVHVRKRVERVEPPKRRRRT